MVRLLPIAWLVVAMVVAGRTTGSTPFMVWLEEEKSSAFQFVTSNKCSRVSRRPASPLGAGRQLGRAFRAPPCSPAAVAELGHRCHSRALA